MPITILGNVDYQCVQQILGEFFRQVCLGRGDSPATIAKKLRGLKRFFWHAERSKSVSQILVRFGMWGIFEGEKKKASKCKCLLANNLTTRPKGLEPSTFGSTVRCSNQLSYSPVLLITSNIAEYLLVCQLFLYERIE